MYLVYPGILLPIMVKIAPPVGLQEILHAANPQEEDASKKLESMGFDVGYRYVEK